MKTHRFLSLIIAAGVTSLVSAHAEDKTTSEKASEAASAIKKTTTNAAHEVADATKRAANRMEAAIEKPDADARKVDVKVSESGVQMPTNLPVGKTAFIVKNTGKQPHNFEVEGSGIDKSFWINLPPNESKTMQVDLKPGTYEADCHVKGHEKEKKVSLTVK
jgi:uncharacterized cupredoxin-like copper-binding protein